MTKKIASQEKIQEQAALFKALADPTRLKLLSLLSQQRMPDALCVNALAGLLGVTQSAISQHLRILKNIGLVNGERRGYHVHYSINRQTMKSYQKHIVAVLTTVE